jgi:hypothetical protein
MLNEHASARLLGVVRIAVFGLWLANVLLVHLEDLAALPPELLSRHGVLRLIPLALWREMWDPAFLFAMKAALVVTLVWSMLGLRGYQAVAIAACVGITLFDGMEKSLGHINHSKFVMLYAAWVLAAFPSADAVSLAPRRGAPAAPVLYAAPVIAISLLILVPYSMIGAFRLARGGPEIFFGDALEAWFLKRSLEPSATAFRFGITVVENAALLAVAKLGFALTGVLELLSPLCLVSRRFRWLWIPVMIGFHFFSLVTMNIFFWQNALLILLVITDCDRLLAPRSAAASAAPGRAASH